MSEVDQLRSERSASADGARLMSVSVMVERLEIEEDVAMFVVLVCFSSMLAVRAVAWLLRTGVLSIDVASFY